MDRLVFKMRSSQINIDADIDRLARRLSETHLPRDTTVHAEIQDQDRIADASDQEKKTWIYFPPGTSFDEQLLILGGGESLLHPSTNHVTDPRNTQPVQNTASPHLHPPSSSASPSLSQTAAKYTTHYTALIALDSSANTLSHAPLPLYSYLLDELSTHMADQVYERCRRGFTPVLPPIKHPWYPFWMQAHEGNLAIERLVRREAERERWEGGKENVRD